MRGTRALHGPGVGTLFAIGLLALVASMAIALANGAVDVPVDRVIATVVRRLGGPDGGVTRLEDQLVWQLRMPRVLGAVAVGATLALCGAVLQSLTRNDLADPYLLGISGGATVGAVSVIVLGASVSGLTGQTTLSLAAFVGALAALAVVLVVASGRSGALTPTRTVLAGVAIAQLCSAYTSLVILMAGDGDAARRALSWSLGSLAGIRWDTAVILLVTAGLAVAAFTASSDSLDAFAFGETSARTLGIAVVRTRWVLLIVSALVTAIAVAYVGAIGFVGLVVPHLVRLVIGPGHRLLLPASALCGAILLVWADTIARSLVNSQEIPIGAVTSLIGVPFFVWLLQRKPVGT